MLFLFIFWNLFILRHYLPNISKSRKLTLGLNGVAVVFVVPSLVLKLSNNSSRLVLGFFVALTSPGELDVLL